MKPYVMNHRAAASSPADLSFLHDAPVGKDGYPSRGSVELPPKEDIPMWAATLAHQGR